MMISVILYILSNINLIFLLTVLIRLNILYQVFLKLINNIDNRLLILLIKKKVSFKYKNNYDTGKF